MMTSEAYRSAERAMAAPPVAERGRNNQNPAGIGFWALVAEDFRTHERRLFEQGFWAVFTHRFGNWRMGQPKLIRAPATLVYLTLFKLNEILGGVSLWYTVKLGRRVRLWHHSGMILGCRAIGDDVQLRQNTTLGVAQTGVNDALPIIGHGADIGAGACVAGAVYVGRDAKIGANALVLTDVPDGATVMGNPAQIVRPATPRAASPAPSPAQARRAEPSGRDAPPMVSKAAPLGTLALLGSANLDTLAADLGRAARALGLRLNTYAPPFGQARIELLAEPGGSALDAALADGPAAAAVVERAEDVLGDLLAAPLSVAEEDAEAAVEAALEPMIQTVRLARERIRGPIFVLSLASVAPSPLGLADGGSARGARALIARANAQLAALAESLPDVRLLDAGAMVAEVGGRAADPGEFWHIGRVPFGAAFNAHLARRLIGALLAVRGRTARLIVLDLDNTLWGGVLGEDGLGGIAIGGGFPGTAYSAFQHALRSLADRGIALAIASKNDADLALEALETHPEIVLRPKDFVAHRIDWSEKAKNIQDMLDEIGLGAGSCLFIDDNPVEREKVRQNLPEAIVPEFPDEPQALARWLLENPFLECIELTASDTKRTAQYKVRAKVNAARRDFQNVEDFYRDLAMRLSFEPYGETNRQRVLQLFAKTNQFNTTTRRHGDADIAAILAEGGSVWAVGVEDRHSAHELMGVIVFRPAAAMARAYPDLAEETAAEPEALWVDSFLLSCRILGRTVETAILAWAARRAHASGAPALRGLVVETPRNTPARGVFGKAGFTDAGGGVWRLDLAAPPPGPAAYFEVAEIAGAASPPSGSAPRTPDAATCANGRSAPASTPGAAQEAVLSEDDDARLARAFRQLFMLAPEFDLAVASMDTVEQWDSLGQLKLAMEVEQTLGVRLPAASVAEIRTYPQLAAAIAGARG